jgi:hypothetical protein
MLDKDDIKKCVGGKIVDILVNDKYGDTDILLDNGLKIHYWFGENESGLNVEKADNIVYKFKGKIPNNFLDELVGIKECDHNEGSNMCYDFVVCKACGMIKTDSGNEWGIAKNKWFKNYFEAEFYRDNGRYPE